VVGVLALLSAIYASVLVAHDATDSTKCRAARRRPQLGRR
jgi:hypothetical protein